MVAFTTLLEARTLRRSHAFPNVTERLTSHPFESKTALKKDGNALISERVCIPLCLHRSERDSQNRSMFAVKIHPESPPEPASAEKSFVELTIKNKNSVY